MQRGCHDSGVGVEIWECRWESGRQHRLSRSWLSQKKHVVPTGSRNFHRRDCFRLTAHVRHVYERWFIDAFPLAVHPHPPVERSLFGLSPRPCDQVRQVREVNHVNAAYQTRLRSTCRRNDHAAHAPRTRCQNSRQDAAHRLDTPIQRKLTNEHRIFKSHGRHEARRQSNGRRDRQIESRP